LAPQGSFSAQLSATTEKKLFLYSAGKSQKIVSRFFTKKAIKHTGCFIAVKRSNERFLSPRFFYSALFWCQVSDYLRIKKAELVNF